MRVLRGTKKLGVAVVAVFAVAIIAAPATYAALTTDSTLSQQITGGVLSTSIRDNTGVVVASPSFTINSVAVSTAAQTATGTFGSSTQRIYVDNPGGADNGWSLSLAAKNGAPATWNDGSGHTYAFNGTTTTGQLTINPSVATLTPTGTNTATGVTRGTQATFTGATPISILVAGNTAEKIWNGYLTGVGVSQIIPASQPAGTYTIELVQTVAAQ